MFDEGGARLSEHVLAPGEGTARQFLVHPEGRKVLVLSEGAGPHLPVPVWYVELPAK